MRLRRSLVACALLCLFAIPAQSQTERDLRDALRSRAGAPSFSSAASPDALEGAIDAQQYRVGPGDVFSISIGGAEPIVASLSVSADGLLMLPAAGSVDVAGHTLADARREVLDALRPFFRNVRLDVALAQPRRFLVHVSGAVPNPGRFVATPVARVADVLQQAFAADSLTQATWIAEGFAPSLRQVRVLHRDGTASTIDLQQYRRTGDLSSNPYLRDGDQLVVPSYEIATQSVYVDGAVAFPGAYEHRPGDTAADLVALADGPPRADDARTDSGRRRRPGARRPRHGTRGARRRARVRRGKPHHRHGHGRRVRALSRHVPHPAGRDDAARPR